MTWNYRVVQKPHEEPDQPRYAIHEVYYEPDGSVRMVAAHPASLTAASVEDLRWMAREAWQALALPVIIAQEGGGQ